MESPKIIHEQLKRIDGIKDIAYTRLFENYLKLDLKGSKKLIDITSTDQESVLNKINRSIPIQGMVYTFIHLNKENLELLKNLKTGKETEFHDFTPILFCTNFDPIKKIVHGINLNMLPSSERIKFFEAYYQLYKNFLKDIEQLTEFNKIAINLEYKIAAMSGKNPKIFEYFNKSQHALFNYAYRSYIISNIRRFRMLEYDDWGYIPYFSPKEAFKKISIELIHKTYWDNRNKTL